MARIGLSACFIRLKTSQVRLFAGSVPRGDETRSRQLGGRFSHDALVLGSLFDPTQEDLGQGLVNRCTANQV